VAGHRPPQPGNGGRAVTALAIAPEAGTGYEPTVMTGVDRACPPRSPSWPWQASRRTSRTGTPMPSSARTAKAASPPGWSRPRSTASSMPAFGLDHPYRGSGRTGPRARSGPNQLVRGPSGPRARGPACPKPRRTTGWHGSASCLLAEMVRRPGRGPGRGIVPDHAGQDADRIPVPGKQVPAVMRAKPSRRRWPGQPPDGQAAVGAQAGGHVRQDLAPLGAQPHGRSLAEPGTCVEKFTRSSARTTAPDARGVSVTIMVTRAPYGGQKKRGLTIDKNPKH